MFFSYMLEVRDLGKLNGWATLVGCEVEPFPSPYLGLHLSHNPKSIFFRDLRDLSCKRAFSWEVVDLLSSNLF